MTPEIRARLREIAAKSTQVTAWYNTHGSIRGPFCRWFTATEVAPEYQKHVASISDDCEFGAAAMNNLVPLLDEIERLESRLKRAIEIMENSSELEHSLAEFLASGTEQAKYLEEKNGAS